MPAQSAPIRRDCNRARVALQPATSGETARTSAQCRRAVASQSTGFVSGARMRHASLNVSRRNLLYWWTACRASDMPAIAR